MSCYRKRSPSRCPRPSGSPTKWLRAQSKHGADCSAESVGQTAWLGSRGRAPRAKIVSSTCHCVSPKHQEEPTHRGSQAGCAYVTITSAPSTLPCAPSSHRAALSNCTSACRCLCAADCVPLPAPSRPELSVCSPCAHHLLSMPYDPARPSARVPCPACRARVREASSQLAISASSQLAISASSQLAISAALTFFPSMRMLMFSIFNLSLSTMSAGSSSR